MADYEMSPLERQELFFQRFVNGFAFSDKLDGKEMGFKFLEELQNIIVKDPKNAVFNFNLDLLFLAQKKMANGLLSSNGDDVSGSAWLAPFYVYCHQVAIFTYITKVMKGTLKDFHASPEHKQAFKAVFELTNDELNSFATHPDKMKHPLKFFLDTTISIQEFLFLPEAVNQADQKEKFEKGYTFFYEMTKKAINKSQPLKVMSKTKDDRWDVLMWDGKEHTALKNDSVDELLSKTGHTYKIEELYKQRIAGLDSPLEREMKERRIVRELVPVQVAQKGMTRDSYFKQIQRIAQIGTLFGSSIIRLGTKKHPERVLDDNFWLDDKTPKACPETQVYKIMEIKAVITGEAKEIYPWLREFNQYPSMRDCLKLFKIFREEKIVDWGDKFPLKG